MQEFEKFVGKLSDFVWGPPLLILLLGTHIFLTFRLRFIQRYLGKAIKLSVQRSHEGQGDVSQFGALTTALAATIGTGNIVGVATAIAAGGPGAVFWMWLTGVFGIATKYSEAVLSVKYRIINQNRTDGRRSDVCPRARNETEMARSHFRHPDNHFRIRHREHGPGKLHFVDGKRNVSHRAMDHRHFNGGAHSFRDPGWNQIHSESLRIPGAVHGHFLRRRLPDSPDNECVGNPRDDSSSSSKVPLAVTP